MHLGCATSELDGSAWLSDPMVRGNGPKPSSCAYCRGSQSRVPRFFTLMFVDHGGSAGREAFGRTRYCESCRRLQAGRGIPARQRYVVTWAVGISRRWRNRTKSGRSGRLGRMVADVAGNMAVGDLRETKEQFAIVREILLSPKVSQVICATDAGPIRSAKFIRSPAARRVLLQHMARHHFRTASLFRHLFLIHYGFICQSRCLNVPSVQRPLLMEQVWPRTSGVPIPRRN